MQKFKKNSEIFEVFTFKEVIEYGKQVGEIMENGMPLSFEIRGVVATYESDDCYTIVPVKAQYFFSSKDVLLFRENGKTFVLHRNLLKKYYELVDPPEKKSTSEVIAEEGLFPLIEKMFVKKYNNKEKFLCQIRVYDPRKNKPKQSEDDITFSDDVYIIDENNVLGVAYYSFEDEEWKFHTDTLVDYDEPGNETEWRWFYSPFKNTNLD